MVITRYVLFARLAERNCPLQVLCRSCTSRVTAIGYQEVLRIRPRSVSAATRARKTPNANPWALEANPEFQKKRRTGLEPATTGSTDACFLGEKPIVSGNLVTSYVGRAGCIRQAHLLCIFIGFFAIFKRKLCHISATTYLAKIRIDCRSAFAFATQNNAKAVRGLQCRTGLVHPTRAILVHSTFPAFYGRLPLFSRPHADALSSRRTRDHTFSPRTVCTTFWHFEMQDEFSGRPLLQMRRPNRDWRLVLTAFESGGAGQPNLEALGW